MKKNKIKVMQFAKLQAVMTTLLGVLAGLVYSVGGLIIDILVSLNWITYSDTPGLSIGTVYAFGAIIGMPVIFGAIGFIAGIIEALLYNLYSSLFKGISIDI